MDTNTNNESRFATPLLTFAAVMTFIIMLVGIFGNFLTIAALIRCPKVRNVAAAFIISLCLADLLFCALVLPFSAIRYIEGTWTHGEVLCKIIPFIQYGNIGCSLLSIGMITINRYVMIAHHSVYSRIYRKEWISIMIAFCWLFSYGMQIPTLLGIWGKFGYDKNLETCSILPDDNGNSSKTALFIIAFLIPCLIIIACYTKIFWVVHKSEMRMKKHANKELSLPNNLRPTNPVEPTVSDSSFSTNDHKLETQKPTRVKDQREQRAKRNEWRITKMVLAIFLSFLICYLPITIAKVADKNVAYPTLHILSYIMLYMSACINPIIYVIMNKQYRKAYKTVLSCMSLQQLPFVKKQGANGAGQSGTEKWKDTGFNNNHSRTIVSQMSTTDPPATTNSSSCQPAQITSCSLELVPSTPMDMQPKRVLPSAVLAIPRTGARETPHNRITLVGGDIIVEEEEEQPSPPALVMSSFQTMEPSVPISIIQSKKVPYYGQNINTPAEETTDSKLTPKLKM